MESTKAKVIHLNSKTVWTLEEANELVPILTKITDKYWNLAEELASKSRYFQKTGASTARINGVTKTLENNSQEWAYKLTKLGVTVFAGGFVGFDMGVGYYSWYYPEKSVIHFHNYSEPPSMRREFAKIGLAP